MSTKQSSASPEIQIPNVDDVIEIWQKFYKDSMGFVIKCKKPDRKEFVVMVQACIIGFSIMGFAG
jgi:protein transport protein SEC61 subunit gamma-like protein